FDPKTGKCATYQNDSEDSNSLAESYVRSICEDTNTGYLWIGMRHGGLDCLNTRTKTFTHRKHESQSADSMVASSTWRTYIDSQGRFWVGTAAGLDRYDRATGKFIHYQHRSGDVNSISDNTCSSIFEDDSGGVWFGTLAGGVNRVATDNGQFRVWRHDPDSVGLVNDSAQNLYADQKGNLWIAN